MTAVAGVFGKSRKGRVNFRPAIRADAEAFDMVTDVLFYDASAEKKLGMRLAVRKIFEHGRIVAQEVSFCIDGKCIAIAVTIIINETEDRLIPFFSCDFHRRDFARRDFTIFQHEAYPFPCKWWI